jgi:WD40 repeat protein
MPSPQSREEALFQAAVLLTGAERAAFLNGACIGNPALRARLEALLAAHDQPDDLVPTQVEAARPAIKPSLADAPDEAVGQTLGRYKLLERVGEGGCGVVYVAEQTEPVRRRVALKVIKLGMDTKQVVARFEAERQALAMMDHPNIAKVLDAGTTDVGRPYFVMELVRGIRITDYCDQANLSTKDRLDLFIKVCQAIQHAHQKGIIHRDIKPSNILVTLHDGVPVPKVIDFGIAKATEGRLTDNTVYTQLHQFIGTPAYMSPEQAEMSGLDIDTRSDIYSLGVLLYELLAGSTPFNGRELMSQGIDAMRRTIREKEPQRPSTRLATLGADQFTTTAKRRSADTSKLLHQLKGDLDWIVMKCLEKDRQRRYDTANGLAADLKRHLNNEPVTARPPSTAYRFQKAFRRNKVVFAAGAAVALALLLGIIASTWQSVRATQAKRGAVAAQAGESLQRQKAEANEQKAVAAQANEARLRQQAQVQELAARRRAYAADMLLCREALTANNLRRARLLLDRQRPKAGEEDLRGWEWRYFWQRCRGDFLSTPVTQSERVLSARFTDKDNSLITFMDRGRVGLWNLSSDREDFVLEDNGKGDNGTPNSGRLQISADGAWIAAASRKDDGASFVRIWNLQTRSLISELPISTEPITALAISPDKRWLATYVQEKEVSIWNLETRKSAARFHIARTKGKTMVGTVAFSPDGRVLAIGDDETQVRLVDVGTWTERITLPGRFIGNGVMTLEFSPNGRFLAAGSAFNDSRIFVWDTKTDQRVATLEGHQGFITDVTFSPDGKLLASASGDQTIKLWNTDTWQVEDTLLGHRDEVWSVNFSADSRRLVSSGKDGRVHVWPASARRQDREAVVLPTDRNPSLPDVSPDGRTIVDVSRQGKVRLLEMATLHERPVPIELGDDNVKSFWLSPNEVLIGSRSPLRIKTWNVSNNAITTHPLTTQGDGPDFSFFPRSNLLVVTSGDFTAGNATLTRWDTASRKEIGSYTSAERLENFREAAFSPDGQWLALANGGQVEVRNLTMGQVMPPFRAQSEGIQGLAILSGQKWVVTAGTEAQIINVWDFTTQEKKFPLPGHNLVIASISVSPDERRLASSTIGSEPIKIWETQGWTEVASIEGRPRFRLLGGFFLQDGNTFIGVEANPETQGEDVRLWRAPSFEEIAAAEAKENAENKHP